MKKQQPKFALEHADCIVLAVDASLNASGYAIMYRGNALSLGVLSLKKGFSGVVGVCREAAGAALVKGIPWQLVIEAPGLFTHRRASARAVLGIGAAYHIWRVAAIQTGLKEDDLHEIAVSTWRKEVFGRGALGTDAAKRMAKEKASRLSQRPIADHNTAEAFLVGTIASRLESVHSRVARLQRRQEVASRRLLRKRPRRPSSEAA